MVLPIIAWTFPYATDDPVRREDAIAQFYTALFNDNAGTVIKEKDTLLAQHAAVAKVRDDIPGQVRGFVAGYHLEQAKILDVGSGEGYLQDVVADYTGIDIAQSVASRYHKPFVLGTATAMPFADNAFDAEWSVWVLEHIPNPEAALREMRRTVKPGGYLLLYPAWNVKPWAARGLDARPYRDLGIVDSFAKATIPIRSSPWFWVVTHAPARMMREMWVGSMPSTFHYRRLTPNFAEYWQADSDAVNNLDQYEAALWFLSRGDACLTCARGVSRYLDASPALVIRVRPDKT
jgi:SAM-dependent methyltransferase